MEQSLMTNKKHNYYTNFGALIYLNIIILLMQSFTGAGKNILYNVFADANYTFLGPTQYMCNYFFGPLTLLYVDVLLRKFRFNKLFYVSSFSLNLFLIGGLIVTICQDRDSKGLCQTSVIISTSMISSIIAGILSTVFYVSFTTFINSLSNSQNKSFYYGLSYSLNSAANIFANIIGYLMLSSLGQTMFYSLIVGISLIIQFLFFGVKDFRDESIEKEERTSLQEIRYQFISIKKQIFDLKFRKLFYYLCFAGLMNSLIFLYQPVLAINSLVDQTQKNQKTFIIFFVSSLGQILGGTTAGKLSEYINRHRVIYIILSFVLIGNTIALLAQSFKIFWLACLAAFFYGITDTSISAMGLTILTTEVSRDNHVFAAFNLCQSLGFGLPSIWWLNFNQRNYLWDIGFIYITTLGAICSVAYYTENTKGIRMRINLKSVEEESIITTDL